MFKINIRPSEWCRYMIIILVTFWELLLNVSYNIRNLPVLKQQSHMQGAININKGPWIEQCCLRDRKKRRKEKLYNFTHPAYGFTNSHPHIKQRKRMGTRKKGVSQEIKQEKSGISLIK